MENKEKTEVIYTKAKVGKRMLAHLIDVGIFFITGVILFTIANSIMTNSDFYKGKNNELVQLRNDSKLYVNGEIVTDYVENSGGYTTVEQKKNVLANNISEFYSNATYFNDLEAQRKSYDDRRINATYGEGVHLFVYTTEGVVTGENPGADVNELYSFYKNEINSYSLVHLFNNINYINLSRFTFIVTLTEIIVSVIIPFVVFYYILPTTCFKRGRQTIGMKLEKVGIITIHAVNQTFGVFTLRTLFNFCVFVLLNFVSFFIPTFISLGMMYMSKVNNSLTNYIFNDYVVDVSSQDIYLDDLERIEAQNSLKEITLSNRDFTLK